MRSKRGVGGGYVLAYPPEDITLADIVAAVEGPQLPMSEHPDHCEGHCILQEVWVGVDEESRRVLEHVTLADLVERTRSATATAKTSRPVEPRHRCSRTDARRGGRRL